ncbi:MAG: lysylphosphatidylglycerol synthase transmembrane domain-containing protein [Bacteroidales bacterium]
MNATLKKALQLSFFLLLTGALLWYSFKDISLEKLWIDLKSADYSWVVIAIAFGFIAYISRAIRWQLLIAPLGHSAKFRNVFNAVAIGYFANFLFPRLGEVARCGALTKTEKIPLNKLIGTVIAERFFDLICLLIILFTTVILQIDTFGTFMQQNILQKASTNSATSLFNLTLIITISITLSIILGFIFRKKIRSISFVQSIIHFARGMAEGFKSILSMQKRTQFLLHTLIIWTCYWGMAFVLLQSLPVTAHLSPLDGLVIMLLGSFGIVLPTNGGLGAFHAIISIGMHAIYGIAKEEGMAYATISHESQMLFMLVVGLFAYLQLFLFAKQSRK